MILPLHLIFDLHLKSILSISKLIPYLRHLKGSQQYIVFLENLDLSKFLIQFYHNKFR